MIRLRVGKIVLGTNQPGQLTRIGLRGISYYMIYILGIKTKGQSKLLLLRDWLRFNLCVGSCKWLPFCHSLPICFLHFQNSVSAPEFYPALALLVLSPILLDRGTEWATWQAPSCSWGQLTMTTLQDRHAVNQGERCKNSHMPRNMNYKPNLKRLKFFKVAKTEKLIQIHSRLQ